MRSGPGHGARGTEVLLLIHSTLLSHILYVYILTFPTYIHIQAGAYTGERGIAEGLLLHSTLLSHTLPIYSPSLHTVCPGSSDPPEKIFNIFSSENEVCTIN